MPRSIYERIFSRVGAVLFWAAFVYICSQVWEALAK